MEKFQTLLAALQRHPVISEVAGRHLLCSFVLLRPPHPFSPRLFLGKQNQFNRRASVTMHLLLFHYQPGVARVGEAVLWNWMTVSKPDFVVVVGAAVTEQCQAAPASLHHTLKGYKTLEINIY